MWRYKIYLVGTAATRTTTAETNVIAIISQPCATFLPNSNFNVSCECLHRCVCVCVCVCVPCVCLLASVCCSCCIVVAFQWRTSPDMLHSSNYTCAFLEATSYGSCTGKNNNNNNYWSFSYCYCCSCCNSMWVCVPCIHCSISVLAATLAHCQRLQFCQRQHVVWAIYPTTICIPCTFYCIQTVVHMTCICASV